MTMTPAMTATVATAADPVVGDDGHEHHGHGTGRSRDLDGRPPEDRGHDAGHDGRDDAGGRADARGDAEPEGEGQGHDADGQSGEEVPRHDRRRPA